MIQLSKISFFIVTFSAYLITIFILTLFIREFEYVEDFVVLIDDCICCHCNYRVNEPELVYLYDLYPFGPVTGVQSVAPGVDDVAPRSQS